MSPPATLSPPDQPVSAEAPTREEVSDGRDAAAGPPGEVWSRLRRTLVLGLVAFAAVAAGVMLAWPLGFDQGVFALNGATLLDGGQPYRDAWETRGPLAFYLFAALDGVFGRSAWPVRLLDVGLLAGLAALLWRVVRRYGSREGATVAAALWTLFVVASGYNDTAQPDLWVAYALVLTAALGARGVGAPGRARGLVLAGVLVGLCGLLKPFYLGFGLVPVLGAYLAWRAAPGAASRALLGDFFRIAAGAAAPVVAAVGALAAGGVLGEFVAVHLRYNAEVYVHITPLPLSDRLREVLSFAFGSPTVALALPAAAAGFAAVRRREPALAWSLAVGAALGALWVVVQGKFWPYHWATVTAVLAVLASVGLVALARVRAARGYVLAAAAVLGAPLLLDPARAVVQWARYAAGRDAAARYYGRFGEGWEVNPADQRAAAAFLRAHTAPGTPVAMWGVDAAVPFLAHRPPVGRFPIQRGLLYAPDAPQTQAYRREYAAAVRGSRAPYLVYSPRAGRQPGPDLAPAGGVLPELADVFPAQYRVAARFGDLVVYARAAGPPPNAPAGAPPIR